MSDFVVNIGNHMWASALAYVRLQAIAGMVFAVVLLVAAALVGRHFYRRKRSLEQIIAEEGNFDSMLQAEINGCWAMIGVAVIVAVFALWRLWFSWVALTCAPFAAAKMLFGH